MPSKFSSPYASSFKSGLKSGTPCGAIVKNIANRTHKPSKSIWNSLYNAGLVCRAKFNGQWVYWPVVNTKKASVSNLKQTQIKMWQCFVDWCVAGGYCTPNQLNNNVWDQKSLMNFCAKFFNKQLSAVKGKTKKSPKRKPAKKSRTTTKAWKNWTTSVHSRKHSRGRTTSRSIPSWGRTTIRGFKFPTFKTRPSTRRYTKAA